MAETGRCDSTACLYLASMELLPDDCYRAMMARDPRFDGRFFVGVTSTMVYCRPVCTAPLPRRANCRFFPNAPMAEAAEFRPCLRCRPELAPGNSYIDAPRRSAHAAMALLEDRGTGQTSVAELAQAVGLSQRQLRRCMTTEFGVSPKDVILTQRLLMAKRLLTDTPLPLADVARYSGIGSVRRLNSLMNERYGMAPGRFRRKAITKADAFASPIVAALRYMPPFAYEALLSYFHTRGFAGVEYVDPKAGIYCRTLSYGNLRGWIEVDLDVRRQVLIVTLAPTMLPLLSQLLARVKRMFDLTANPTVIAEGLGTVAQSHPGLRIPGSLEPWEVGVRAILGKQISVKAATTLAKRWIQLLGTPIDDAPHGLTHFAPDAETVAKAAPETLRSIGITQRQTQALIAYAQAVAQGTVQFGANTSPEALSQVLQKLPGIGPWTADYIAMRGLGAPDCFLPGDLGIRKALGGLTPSQCSAVAEAWRPWRSYATHHLWKNLETPA